MAGPSPEFLMRAVDLLVILGTLLTLVYMLARGLLTSWVAPVTGAVLVLIGLGMGILAYLGEAIGQVFPDLMVEAGKANFVGTAIPEWLHWLLSRAAFLLVLVGLTLAAVQRFQAERAIGRSAQKVRAAEDNVLQSEARFRHLFETTSNAIFCYAFDPPMPVDLPVAEQVRRSHDAILTECNQVFVNSFKGPAMDEIIGSRMGILDGNKDSKAHFDYFSAFVNNDYRLTDYELAYKTAEGEERAVRSSLTGIVSNGLLHRFWAAESDILDLRRSQAALARRESYQALLGDISSRLVKASDETGIDVLRNCMQDVCKHIDADRTSLIWYDPANNTVEVGYVWSRGDNNFAMPTTLKGFPHIVDMVSRKKSLRVNDTKIMPAEFNSDRDGLRKIGSRAFIILPLIIDGEMRGISSYSMLDRPRQWTDQEMADMQVFAELFANFLMRLRSRRELKDALQGLRRATDRLEAENVYLREEVERTTGFDDIVGESPALLDCLRLVRMVAATTTPVLVLGETGTGKELIARAIHQHSERRDRPLVKVNCAALPANLIESELFGYEKGAFTGADRAKRGRFDLADGSTLFLDEIGDIPLELQPKLLRALQEGEFERLGGSDTIKVDVRIVAATNKALRESVASGEFRADLFYRIGTFPVELPPLRDRGDDIQLLAEHFVKTLSPNVDREVSAIAAEAMYQMREYHWPGNVRELEGVIQRALISSSGPVLQLAGPLSSRGDGSNSDVPRVLRSTVNDLRSVEREHIIATLESTNWKISGQKGAAAMLGIPPSTLRSRMKKLSISRPH